MRQVGAERRLVMVICRGKGVKSNCSAPHAIEIRTLDPVQPPVSAAGACSILRLLTGATRDCVFSVSRNFRIAA